MPNTHTNIAAIIDSILSITEIQAALENVSVSCYTTVASVSVERQALDIGHGETFPHWIIVGEAYQYADTATECLRRTSISRELAIH